jgi:hypothetical protein
MALKNRHLVFAKNCSNAHGTFAKGDAARGAFSDQLVADYLAVGILVEREAPAEAAPADTEQAPVTKSRKR